MTQSSLSSAKNHNQFDSLDNERVLKSLVNIVKNNIRIKNEKVVQDLNELNTIISNEKYIYDEASFAIPYFESKHLLLINKNYSLKVQNWIGHVIEVDNDTFCAELTDLTNGGTKEIGEFDILQVSHEDRDLLKVGAAFYWSIGYSVQNGQSRTESFLRFQRLINWTEEDYDDAADNAESMYSKFIN